MVHFLFPVCKFVQPHGQVSEGACQEDVTTWGDPVIRNEDRDFVNTCLLVHKHVKISVDEWILETTRPQKHVKFLEQYIP